MVTKRISPNAYNALREALSVAFHFKRPFEQYLRTCLRDNPEVLVSLDFKEPKRQVVDILVQRLAADEPRYQQVTLDLMVETAAMTDFPDLRRQEDAPARIAEATEAVANLRRWTEAYTGELEARELAARERDREISENEARVGFLSTLRGLQERFTILAAMNDAPQERGRLFETFLSDLFRLFDLAPRLGYSLGHEQVDGSITFDTDDYIVEARWRANPLDRADADVFAAKVRRKGKNALGLLVSVAGLTKGALEAYAEATPFMALDGYDLTLILDDRIRLDDLLRLKKRHANETGGCFLAARDVVSR